MATAVADRRPEDERRCGAEAVEADACGALGCREGEDLREVHCDGERRVLCEEHARRWLDR
jgi:hypothetical protein